MLMDASQNQTPVIFQGNHTEDNSVAPLGALNPVVHVHHRDAWMQRIGVTCGWGEHGQ